MGEGNPFEMCGIRLKSEPSKRSRKVDKVKKPKYHPGEIHIFESYGKGANMRNTLKQWLKRMAGGRGVEVRSLGKNRIMAQVGSCIYERPKTDALTLVQFHFNNHEKMSSIFGHGYLHMVFIQDVESVQGVF